MVVLLENSLPLSLFRSLENLKVAFDFILSLIFMNVKDSYRGSEKNIWYKIAQ